MTRRILSSYLALIAVVLAVLVIPLGVINARNEERDLSAKVERDAQAVASLAEDALEARNPAALERVREVARDYARRTGGRILVLDTAGDSVVDPASETGRSFRSRPEVAEALSGDIATGTRPSRSLGTDLLYVAVPVASGGVVHGAVRVTYPTSTLDERVREYWLLLAAIAAIALALAAVVGFSLARWASRPLAGLGEAAIDVGRGDLDARAPVAGPPEVRTVAEAFNETVGKLAAHVDAQEAFVADASHQLRTPLTALRLRLDNLEPDVSDHGRADLDAATAEVQRLDGLVDELLTLARAESGAPPTAPLDASAVVAERIEMWSALAEERGVGLVLVAGAPAPPGVAATSERLQQVLDNLLSNALGAAPVGSIVRVSVGTTESRGVQIVVEDAGPGLTSDERERAFDRFWRRGGGSGSGLGLPIAKRLVEADGGTITLEDADGGGLRAVVRLRRWR